MGAMSFLSSFVKVSTYWEAEGGKEDINVVVTPRDLLSYDFCTIRSLGVAVALASLSK